MTGGRRGDEGDLDHQFRLNHEFVVCVGVLILAVLLELLVVWFIRSKGVDLTGDEPSYIIQAQSYLHLSPHILSTIKADLRGNRLSAYPPGAPVSSVASFPGPRGVISPFEPGLGLLLTPFVAAGRLYLGATVGMLVLNTAGLILIHRRATSLMGLGRRCQILLALLLAAPAVLLAMTQIYPDLISGVLLACGIVEVAIIERTGTVTRFNSVIVLVSAAILPWLQVKNFLPAVVVVAAYAFAAYRSRGSWRATVAVCGVAVVSWVVLLAYNLLYFRHLLGLPEPSPRLTGTGVEYTLGLLFDRDQGMFVQVPFAVIGLVGMWLARKRLPAAVLATVVSAGAILILNGTYIANPYGGLSFAGRFMWTLLPITTVWIAVVLARWQKAGRLMWAPIVVVCLAWIYQARPILQGDHTYYNMPAPWDPASWPGWWPGFSTVLPQFDVSGRPFGAPAFAFLLELGVLAVIIIAACQYMKPGDFSRWSAVVTVALGLLVVVALLATKPLSPSTTLSYDANQLGAPVSGTDQPSSSPDVTLQGVLPGTYRLTLSYLLTGPASAGAWVVSCNSSAGAPPQSVTAHLDPGHLVKAIQIRCRQSGTVSTQLNASQHSVVNVGSLKLQKIAV